MKISVIVPVYNEENFIKQILERIRLIQINIQIIVINDGSTDKTKNILDQNKHLYDDLINIEINSGKGFAIQQGIKKIKGDIVIIQDADLEYNPKDYSRLLEPFNDPNVKCVYGSRVLPGASRSRPKSISFLIRTFANHFLTFLSNLLNNQSLTDAHTCYKVFRSDLIKSIELKENGFDFCPEITAKVSKKKIKILEVPVSYVGRTHEEGKKIKLIDGFKAIKTILYYNLIK